MAGEWIQPLTTIGLAAPAGVGLVFALYRVYRSSLHDLVDGTSKVIADTRDRVAALETRVEGLEKELRIEQRRVRQWQEVAHRLWIIVQAAGLTVPDFITQRMNSYDAYDDDPEGET